MGGGGCWTPWGAPGWEPFWMAASGGVLYGLDWSGYAYWSYWSGAGGAVSCASATIGVSTKGAASTAATIELLAFVRRGKVMAFACLPAFVDPAPLSCNRTSRQSEA